MAPPNPQCAAVAAAKEKKGLSYPQIVDGLRSDGLSINEERVIDICTGTKHPTQKEFDALARVLGIQPSSAPHDSAHATV